MNKTGICIVNGCWRECDVKSFCPEHDISNLKPNFMTQNKSETVEVPIAWFEGLLEIAGRITQDDKTWLPHLLGYIKSAITIIKYNKND